MRRVGTLLCIIVFAFFAAYAEGKEKNQIRIQCQIFKLTGSLPGKRFVDESIWTTEETPDALKDKVTVFSRGWFEFGKDRLEFKDGRCFWKNKAFKIDSQKKVKLQEDRIKLIYSPEIVVDEHKGGAFNIGSEQPIQYFSKRKDGLFELKEMELPTGLFVEITEAVEEEDKGYIRLTDIEMTMRSVGRRERIPGVNLSVGRPILSEQKYVFYFRVRPGKDYGILIRPEVGQGGFLIRLRASSTRSGTFTASNQKDKKKR